MAGVRLTRSLTPAHVGERVMVRRTLPEGGMGDLLGILVDWTGDRLTLRLRDGDEVVVEERAMVAGKPVPPPPAPRARRVPAVRPAEVAPLDLERAAALGWPPLEAEPLGEWTLRASGGFTGRGNSVLPLGEPGLPLDEALARVTAWYAARSLPPLFQVPLPPMAALDDALVARGWEPYNPTAVLAAGLPEVLRAVPARPDLPAVAVGDEPGEAWLAAYHYRGGALPAVAREVLRGGRVRGFAEAREGTSGAVLGIARVAVGEGWAGVTAVEVVPAARRRGLAAQLLRACCEWAGEQGASAVYVQVAEENAPALALYGGVGFREHHRYRYVRAGSR